MSDYQPRHARPELPAIFDGLRDLVTVIEDTKEEQQR